MGLRLAAAFGSSLFVVLLGACGAPLGEGAQTEQSDRALVEQCFVGATPNGRVPLTKVIHELRAEDWGTRIDVTIIFNRDFVDLSYGANAVGWEDSKKGSHKFKDLVGSDHTEIALQDRAGVVQLQTKLDLLSDDDNAPSGYASMGSFDGDGKILQGPEDSILAYGSSLDDNLNARGLMFLEDSPATDASYSPSPEAPDWNYFVEYRMSVDAKIFGAIGFGRAEMAMVHASPSKLGENTVTVEEEPCPDPGSDGDPFPNCPLGECLDAPNGGDSPEPSDTPDPGLPDAPSGGDSCQVSSDCGSGQQCAQGVCIPSL